ncbi:hypothetical protein SBOR_3274 [Sclerotinia borealis F-4128]|uniref:Uncharacterized protein n=1 Tax=Sclerotinia borealis (strain F-4128) TaxID=1432307 RepID=W9CHX6_SCLBF|nr:hypothetical protein SBOR_3274 [Sclerotinia borealis F-4128]
MSPPPSVYLQPDREREHRRTHTRAHHVTSTRSPSTASTLRSPPENLSASVDSLVKPQVASQTQHRPHRTRHSHPPIQSTHNISNQPQSHTRSSAALPSTTTLTPREPSVPIRLPHSPPYAISSPATFSRASTLISTQAPPIALEFLNFLDDLGVLVLCKPLLELCNVEWITLFDDMGIFYLCEPMGAIRRVLRKLKIGRVDREKGGGSCLGSSSTWDRDTVSWLSNVASEVRSGRGGRSKRHAVSGGRSRGSEGANASARSMAEGNKEIGSVSGIGSGSVNGSERISGANRRRSERAASSVAASGSGQSLEGGPRRKVVD